MVDVPPHVIENEVAAALWRLHGAQEGNLRLRREWTNLNETSRKPWRRRARTFTRMLRAQGVEIK